MKAIKTLLLMVFCMLASMSFAVGPDLTSLTSAIDWTTVVTALLAAGAAGLLIILAVKGVVIIYKIARKAG
jgi:hypothetical protein